GPGLNSWLVAADRNVRGRVAEARDLPEHRCSGGRRRVRPSNEATPRRGPHSDAAVRAAIPQAVAPAPASPAPEMRRASPPPCSSTTDTEWPCSRRPAWPIPAPILTQSPVSSTDGKPTGGWLPLKRRFEVGRGGGAWGFVICASAACSQRFGK